jgi:hypothetical protein
LALDNDYTTLKLRLIFERELLGAAETGKIDPVLWEFLDDLFNMTAENTQDIEGVNSVIRHIVDLAPSVSLATLSSRVVIKKILGCSVRMHCCRIAYMHTML